MRPSWATSSTRSAKDRPRAASCCAWTCDPKVQFKTVLPAGDSVLQTLTVGDDAVYVRALDAGRQQLWRVGTQDGKGSAAYPAFLKVRCGIETAQGVA